MVLPMLDHIRVEVLNGDGTVKETRFLRPEPGQPFCVRRASTDISKSLVPSKDNVTFDCKVVSRDHALIESTTGLPGPVFVKDTSRYGTFVNGKRLTKGISTKISSGDTIKFGHAVVHSPDHVTHAPIEARIHFAERDPLPELLTTVRKPFSLIPETIDLTQGADSDSWFGTPVSVSSRAPSPCPTSRNRRGTFVCPSTSSGDEDTDEDDHHSNDSLGDGSTSPVAHAESITAVPSTPRKTSSPPHLLSEEPTHKATSSSHCLASLFATSPLPSPCPSTAPSVERQDLPRSAPAHSPDDNVGPVARMLHSPIGFAPRQSSPLQSPALNLAAMNDLHGSPTPHLPTAHLTESSHHPCTEPWLDPVSSDATFYFGRHPLSSPLEFRSGDNLSGHWSHWDEYVALREDSRNFMCQNECSCCDYGDNDSNTPQHGGHTSTPQKCPKPSRFDQPAQPIAPRPRKSTLYTKAARQERASQSKPDQLHWKEDSHYEPVLAATTDMKIRTSEDDKLDGPRTPTDTNPATLISVVDSLQATRTMLNEDVERFMACFKLPGLKLPEEKNTEPDQQTLVNSRPDHRLSIGNLVNATPELPQPSRDSVLRKVAPVTKRKASELGEAVVEPADQISNIVWTEPRVVVPHPPRTMQPTHHSAVTSARSDSCSNSMLHTVQIEPTASAVITPRPAKRIKSALNSAFTATAYAALGSIATIGFLASPFAERLAGL